MVSHPLAKIHNFSGYLRHQPYYRTVSIPDDGRKLSVVQDNLNPLEKPILAGIKSITKIVCVLIFAIVITLIVLILAIVDGLEYFDDIFMSISPLFLQYI